MWWYWRFGFWLSHWLASSACPITREIPKLDAPGSDSRRMADSGSDRRKSLAARAGKIGGFELILNDGSS